MSVWGCTVCSCVCVYYVDVCGCVVLCAELTWQRLQHEGVWDGPRVGSMEKR